MGAMVSHRTQNQQNNKENKMESNGNMAEVKHICDLYNENKFFEIPPYQRLYEWSNDEINELLNDTKEAWSPSILSNSNVGENEQKSSKSYFIGTVTISVKTNEKEQDKENNDKNKVYKLIDGQQRLTTLWFIGFYLASNEKCGDWQKKWQEFIIQGNKLRIAMPIRDNEQNSLTNLAKKIVDGEHKFEQDKDGKVNLFKELQNIHQKIVEAFSCIESWFANGNGKDIDLADFAKYIYTKVCFVFVTLAEKTDLNRFFVRMNNRGKQLEKHEILKARMLGVIQKSGGEWQKYAKIWDLCSDMDKYIFQSASDRSILKSKSQNENSAESSNNNDSLVKIADIVEKYKIPEANKSKEKDSPSKVESIVDFPTFLLHCYKLWVAKKCNNKEILQKISITKDNLLEIMWDNQIVKGKNKELIIDDNFTFDSKSNAKQNCKEFIIDMLRYRVLFDYFVIKNTLGDDGFAIMRFYESNGSYRPKAKSFENLIMIQNYLRAARQGEKQNYHHWLTPFLKFLDKHIRLDMNLTLDKTKEFNFDNFKDNVEKIAKQFSNTNKYDEQEKILINFLENLDTKLAIAQLNQTSENDLLGITSAILEDLKVQISQDLDSVNWTFLNNGENTPHYWFYRLEYYLWKWGKYAPEKLGDFSKTLGDYTLDLKKDKCVLNSKYFHFRILGSIEHFSATQREKPQEQWSNVSDSLNIFGNLALISQNLNSSLSNKLEKFKRNKVIEQLERGRLESLKYFIMCANLKGDEWTGDNAQEHQNQMLEILKQSLKISSHNLTPQQSLKIKEY